MEPNWKATLLINRNDSKCYNCQRGANPKAERHDEVWGYGADKIGCGIKWEYVATEYHDERLMATAEDMRPDLKPIRLAKILEGEI